MTLEIDFDGCLAVPDSSSIYFVTDLEAGISLRVSGLIERERVGDGEGGRRERERERERGERD
jgi:hypothetical protein